MSLSRYKSCCCLLFILHSYTVTGQTDTLYKGKNKSNLIASFEGYARHNLYSLGKETFNSNNFDRVKDNPFVHMAIYSAMHLQYGYLNKYKFNFSIIAEERSASGGNNVLNNIVLFPKINLSILDTFLVLNSPFTFKGRFGDMWNENWYDRLRLYNIDFQALDFNIKCKTIFVGYSRIADLSNNIGLGLHETSKVYAGKDWNSNLVVLSWETDYVLRPNNKSNFYSLFYSNNKSNKTYYAQISLRSKNESLFKNSIAGTLGIDYTINSNLKFTSSIRYYNESFNYLYRYPNKIKYRGNQDSRYVGQQLYPLKNFYRSMNQWAFLTDYQNTDVFNFEFTVDYNKKLYKSIGWIASIDFNLIKVYNEWKAFPIYDIGIGIKPIDKIEFRLSATNKHMNLDGHFQTFYLSKKPTPCLYAAKTI